MNELEQFRAMLDKAEVIYWIIHRPSADSENIMTIIKVDNTAGMPTVRFFSRWTFDNAGNLTTVGHWE